MQVKSKNRPSWSEKEPNKTISVFLAIDEKPAVQVDSMVWGRPEMTFVKDAGSDDFDFVSFVPDDNGAPFSDIKKKKKSLSLINDGAEGEWVYTLTVRWNGVDYNSVEPRKPPGGDRPVIRN